MTLRPWGRTTIVATHQCGGCGRRASTRVVARADQAHPLDIRTQAQRIGWDCSSSERTSLCPPRATADARRREAADRARARQARIYEGSVA